jgi:hypothetical protein
MVKKTYAEIQEFIRNGNSGTVQADRNITGIEMLDLMDIDPNEPSLTTVNVTRVSGTEDTLEISIS